MHATDTPIRTGSHRLGKSVPYRRRTAAVGALLIASTMLAACAAPNGQSSGTQSAAADDKPLVATTFTVLADITRNVGAEHVDVVSIVKDGAEIHGYEPTPGDIAKVADADLIIDNGMGLELWFDQFVTEVDAPHITASDGIEPIAIAEDAYAGRPNPHAWMSPENVKIYADNIAAALATIDPEHAADFAANAAAYGEQLDEISARLQTRLADLPATQRALVSCEGAFSYLARDAGLTEKYLWAVNAESQATPTQIASAIDYVKAKNVPAVFCESTVSDAPMQQVVDATGAAFGGVLYVDSLSGDGGPVPTYLELISYDMELIAQGLTKGEK